MVKSTVYYSAANVNYVHRNKLGRVAISTGPLAIKTESMNIVTREVNYKTCTNS